MPTLLLVVFINFAGIGALIPVLPYTVIETFGLSASVMTLLLAFFCLNLSFAQVEASFVLLLRDYLDFDARQAGWLFT